MNPEVKALLDQKPPRGYGMDKAKAEKWLAWDAELRRLRKRLGEKAAKRETSHTAEDLSGKYSDLGRWFLCSECFFGMSDYYSADESQMLHNELNFCPCCGAKIIREEANK
jgi:hypothetical protein